MPVHHALRYVEDYVADVIMRLLVLRPCPMKGTDGEKQQQGTQGVTGRKDVLDHIYYIMYEFFYFTISFVFPKM